MNYTTSWGYIHDFVTYETIYKNSTFVFDRIRSIQIFLLGTKIKYLNFKCLPLEYPKINIKQNTLTEKCLIW